jgi:hypothetical protein
MVITQPSFARRSNMGAGIEDMGDPTAGADPKASVTDLKKQGLTDEQIAQVKGIPIEAVKLNDQLPANAQFGATDQMPGVTGAPGNRSPVLQAIDANPTLAGLDEETKQSIANNPNNPLNPLNPNFTAGTNTDIGRQAQSEKILQDALAKKQQGQISQFGTEYTAAADAKRKALADQLAQQTGQIETQNQAELGRFGEDLASSRANTFKQATPGILEDLNSRGLFTSESAVNNAQSQALANLSAQDESKLGQARLGLYGDMQDFQNQGNQNLNQFDQSAFGQGQDIQGEGLNTLIGGNQSALDSALGLRRNELENKYNMAQSAADRQFASQLAKQQKKGSTGRILASAGKQS